ncbi:MAG: tetratricopeptide repeat protein [Myxococcota bacterium]|nr:tetratricopeptide repeat protein [Myxococcota bacterium]
MILTLLSLTVLGGCSVLEGFLGDGGAQAVADADQMLQSGDLSGGLSAYQTALAENPENVDAAVGAAYAAMLEGDYASADSLLSAAEALAPERAGELQLRRALVAMAQGDGETAKELAKGSGTAAGSVFAAEVHLADAEPDEAIPLLQSASSAPGGVGQTASAYLELLEHDDPSMQGLAENYALWAIGARGVAVKSVEDVVMSMPEGEDDRKASELLLWAGRAASEGEVQVASNLLEAVSFPPPGQAWRVRATRAIIDCAAGAEDEYAACRAGFEELDGLAPADGLLHARATAAMLIEDSQVAVEILGETPNAPAAMAALQAGDSSAAQRLSPGGLLGDFLSAR